MTSVNPAAVNAASAAARIREPVDAVRPVPEAPPRGAEGRRAAVAQRPPPAGPASDAAASEPQPPGMTATSLSLAFLREQGQDFLPRGSGAGRTADDPRTARYDQVAAMGEAELLRRGGRLDLSV